MNLNGQNPKRPSGTILNGKPLTNYDLKKDLMSLRHRKWHYKSSRYSRSHIGSTRLRSLNVETQTATKHKKPKSFIMYIVIGIILLYLFFELIPLLIYIFL